MTQNLGLCGFMVIMFAVSGCENEKSDRNPISSAIENQMVATHRDVDLKKFARFYTYEGANYVVGTYLFANEGYQPMQGKVGRIYWVSPDHLPRVMDGGCAVINIRYHIPTNSLVSVDCNGEA